MSPFTLRQADQTGDQNRSLQRRVAGSSFIERLHAIAQPYMRGSSTVREQSRSPWESLDKGVVSTSSAKERSLKTELTLRPFSAHNLSRIQPPKPYLLRLIKVCRRIMPRVTLL